MHLSKQGQACRSIGPRTAEPPYISVMSPSRRKRQAETGHPEQCRSPKALAGSADHFPEVWGELQSLPFRAGRRRVPVSPRGLQRAPGAAALQLLPERIPGSPCIGTGTEEGAETTSLSHTTGSEFKDVFAPPAATLEPTGAIPALT